VLAAVLSAHRGIVSAVIIVGNLRIVCLDGLVDGSLAVVLDHKGIRVRNVVLLLSEARVGGIHLKKTKVLIERVDVVTSSRGASRRGRLSAGQYWAGRDIKAGIYHTLGDRSRCCSTEASKGQNERDHPGVWEL
jgi:hypothetical protein